MGYEITFKGIKIGDHSWLTADYERDVQIKRIPRADGVIIDNRGGGIQRITVNAWVIKNTRKNIEDYFKALAISFGNTPGILIAGGTSYGSDVYFTTLNPGSEDKKHSFFSCVFVRNPHT